jgi:superfamily II DNA or RNA helicase
MQKIQLRQYQERIKDDVLGAESNDLVQLATGGGKTVIFCSIIQALKGNTLVLVHRDELLFSACKMLGLLGVEYQPINAKIKKINLNKKVFVSMVGTLASRKKKDPNYLCDIDNIIIDEAHRSDFDKVIECYPNARKIGFTATPVRMKKTECLKDNYDRIILGRDIHELIKGGFLVKDVNYALKLDKREFAKLERSESLGTGGYTTVSLNKVFNNGQFIKRAYKEYLKYCNGEKTIVFCCSIDHAEQTTAYFKSMGVNARCYSSKSDTNRKALVEWFEDNDDAVLINVDVFTTGFDVTDIKNVILFRSTRSLALYLQMVGRAGRITDKCFKDHFNCIDLGNNIEEHKAWSYNHDWEAHFVDKRTRAAGSPPVKDCPKCEALCLSSARSCKGCGYIFPPPKEVVIDENGVEVVAVEKKQPKINSLQLYEFNKRKTKKPFDWVLSTVIKRVIESTLRHHNYPYSSFRTNEKATRDRLNDIFQEEYNKLLERARVPKQEDKYKERLNDKINEYYGIRS